MFGPSLTLDKDLYDRIKRCSDAAGYSSPKELIQHVLERELDKIEEDVRSDEEIVKKMQGLGYID